jgi:hypothetical protein
MMSELHRPFADELWPIADETLGEMYSASPHGLRDLIATMPSAARASLAMYCFRRAHLESIGLAIAATCEIEDLTAIGGNALFAKSREPATPPSLTEVGHARRKVSLATGSLRAFRPSESAGD